MSIEVLQRIDDKVTEIYDRLLTGGGSGPGLEQRVAHMESALFSGSGAGLIISSASLAQIIQSTNFVTGSAGWQIKKTGDAEFNNVTVRGTIYATSGEITGTLYVGSAADRIVIDGSTKRISSESFSSGVQGWAIDYDGSAEFENVTIRGTIQTAVLSYQEQHVTAGTQLIVKSAGALLSDVTTVASPTTFNVDIQDPPTGHIQLFAVSDVLKIQNGSTSNWVTVSSVSDQTTFYRYVCTKSSGSNSTFRAGTAVADYGPSGQGGILLTADAANSPYIQVFTHAGSPWSTITEHVRIGNLNGWGPFATDIYGIGFGSYADGNYYYFRPDTAKSILSVGDGNVLLDEDGITIIKGNQNLNQVKWYAPAYELNSGLIYSSTGGNATGWLTIDVPGLTASATSELKLSVNTNILQISMYGYVNDPTSNYIGYIFNTATMFKHTAAALTESGNIIMDGASKSIKGTGSNVPDLGTTTAAEKWGNIYLAASKDIYPRGDTAGLFQRLPNIYITPTDHLTAFSGWTWATTDAFDGAPSTVDVSTYPSILALVNDSTLETHFAYKAASGDVDTYARMSVGTSSYVGLRIDDGSDTNYVALSIVNGTALGTKRFAVDVCTGGSLTTTYYADGIPFQFYIPRLRFSDTLNAAFFYFTIDTPMAVVQLQVTGSLTWSPTRKGIIFAQGGTASDTNSGAVIDWYYTN